MQDIRAAVIEAAGLPTTIETLRLDDPGPGEVLVRMTASGVCHSDLHVRDGDWERPGPIVLGHEGAGVIAGVGPGIDPAVIGRSVALSWYAPCLHCRDPDRRDAGSRWRWGARRPRSPPPGSPAPPLLVQPVFWSPAAMPLMVAPITARMGAVAALASPAASASRRRPSSSTWMADRAST